jgi:hypothetical protein
MFWKEIPMNATLAALFGSLIGAAAALAGAALTSFASLRNERRHQEFEAQAAYVQALRDRSGAAFAQFFSIIQAIEWITWCGINYPDAIDEGQIKSYEDTINGAYRILLGSMAMTASLSMAVYNEMGPLLSGLYSLEARVAVALRRINSERSEAFQELSACGSEAEQLRDTLRPKLNHIMTVAETANKHEDSHGV